MKVESVLWLARINPQDSASGIGTSPEEAVAHLWLALNKKI